MEISQGDSTMKKQELKDITYKKVAWTIKNFSTLKTNQARHSEVFNIGGCAWKIAFYKGTKKNDGKNLAIYLKAADVSSLHQGWSIHAIYRFTVVNQASTKKSVKRGSNSKFTANECDWGYPSFMELAKLQNPSNGYILNDTCIVELEFSEVISEGTEIKKALVPKNDDATEFKDLGQIEKAMVPLLEEACLCHPSLMDCKNKRSRKFTEWVFTSLGRVLQFLENKKWKDMNEEACEQLQQLWDELEISRLDLSWLEPQVKSALSMKGYLEKATKVKRLKQELVVLETEMNKMKENLLVLETEMIKVKENIANTEQSVEMTRKDLIKAEEGFEEKDLDLDTEIVCSKL
ncbi:MATH domain and coiled-coil domain-containing protein At1g31390-like [Neltuma alba]|uniref:MATH domain and coiled-coil domain-containing protein At1g31390-like n=1 Tax=Neltuma alba TaxID=207710 RepID=UPI0010A55EB0|nr:MATH domain and coiled-coil domain-containing protein At1g31390-like [Prosopis alba]